MAGLDADCGGEAPAWPAAELRRRRRAQSHGLYSGGKDTLYRIHGTNQPYYIGQAISSGCIRITNEDVIDLYNRVKMGATVVVL
jgi:lipoprotein-anchoring transpeptidase ErfK/SrfK